MASVLSILGEDKQMSSIWILCGMRKEKRAHGRSCLDAGFADKRFFAFFLAAALLCAPSFGFAAQRGDSVMGTPPSGAFIGKDPETGTHIMKTPDPKPQEEYQGPKTIIVAPEVYPDRPGYRPAPPLPQPR